MENIRVSLTVEKILIVIGAILLAFFGILYCLELVKYNFFSIKTNGGWFIFLGIMYILVVFSTKILPEIWFQIWSVYFILTSIIMVIGIFIANGNVNYNQPLLYVSIVPHILLVAGSIISLIKSFTKN